MTQQYARYSIESFCFPHSEFLQNAMEDAMRSIEVKKPAIKLSKLALEVAENNNKPYSFYIKQIFLFVAYKGKLETYYK